jgi:hypothetical protein
MPFAAVSVPERGKSLGNTEENEKIEAIIPALTLR